MKGPVCLLSAMTVFGVLLSVIGCENAGSTTATGTLRVLVTDKPFPVELIDSARITVTRVEVRSASADDDSSDPDNELDTPSARSAAGGADDNGDGNDNGSENEDDAEGEDGDEDGDDDGQANDNENGDADEGSFVTVFEGEREFELLDLQNGRTDVLAEAELAAGTYSQVRLIVTTGTVVTTDGQEYVLNVPSGAQTGIKLNFSFDIAEEAESVLLLDVDLSRAFNVIPGGKLDDPSQITEIKFRPSLALRLIKLDESGSVTGVISDAESMPIASALVTAYDETDQEVTSTVSDPDGSYVLSGLAAGIYRIEVSAAGFEADESDGIAVSAGEQTSEIDFELIAVNEQGRA